MLERKERRWQFLSLAEVKELCAKETDESIWHNAINDPMMVTSDYFCGKSLKLCFEDGLTWEYDFADAQHLKWKAGDGRESEDRYNASPVPGYEHIFFLHHCSMKEIPGCVDLIVDLESGYAVQFDAALGHPGSPREVIRTIRFGAVDGVTPGPEAVKPCWTNDLTGRAIRWRRANGLGYGIKYTFTSCNYLTYVMKFPGEHTCWIATNPCDYIKLRDDLYICSTIEERQTGVELIMVMNTTMMTDVQSIFGIGGTIEQGIRLETSMHSGRAGSWEEMGTDLFSE